MDAQSPIMPLLDGMLPESEIPGGYGSCTFNVTHEKSGTKLQVKKVSIPESASNIDALLLTGTISEKSEANSFYIKEVNRYRTELAAYSKLVGNDYICGFLRYQVVEKDHVPGYDLYLLTKRRETLSEFLKKKDYSQKDAVNLARDLCEACTCFREAGYMHEHITLQSVVLDKDRFCVGDLGITPMEDLSISTIPSKYISTFTPPELSNVTAKLNDTADTYAIGMILYYMFNGGHLPFEEADSTVKAANKRRIKGEDLPCPMYADYEIDSIIRKACAFNPEDRYKTPAELLEALNEYESSNDLSFEPLIPPLVHDSPITEISGKENLLEETAILPKITNGDELTEEFQENFKPGSANQEEKKRSPLGWLAFLLVLLLGAGAAYYYFYYSAITVNDITLTDSGVDYVTIHVDANYVSNLMITCVSEETGYTETYRCSEDQTFTNLTSSTTYQISVSSLDWHYLKGTNTMTAVTNGYTNIVGFNIKDCEDGTAEVSLQVSGPMPKTWDLICIDDSDNSTVYPLNGNTCKVENLAPNRNYLFRIDAGSGYYLSGETQKSFCRNVMISGSNLRILSSENAQISVAWDSDSEVVTEWTAVCSGGNGYSKTVTTSECAAVFDGISPNSDYTIAVSNNSMDVPLLTSVRISAGKISALKAVSQNSGLVVTWNYEGSYMTDSWIVRYEIESAGFREDITTEEMKAVIQDLLPGTTYTISVLSSGGELLDGTTSIAYTVSGAENYTAHDFGVPSVKLYEKTENWVVTDPGTSVTTVTAGKALMFVMQSMYTPRPTTENVFIQLIIRDEAGQVVFFSTDSTTYDKLWTGKAFSVPFTAPAKAGNYTAELYFNRQFVCKTSMFVNE